MSCVNLIKYNNKKVHILYMSENSDDEDHGAENLQIQRLSSFYGNMNLRVLSHVEAPQTTQQRRIDKVVPNS